MVAVHVHEAVFVRFKLLFYLVENLINLVDVFDGTHKIALIICCVRDCKGSRLKYASSRIIGITSIRILYTIYFDSRVVQPKA